MSAPGEVPVPRVGVVSQHALRQTPPVNRITDSCKNITFPQLRLRAVTNIFSFVSASLLHPTNEKLNCTLFKKENIPVACVPLADRTCCSSDQISAPRSPQVNKFEQVSGLGHQVSRAGGGARLGGGISKQ